MAKNHFKFKKFIVYQQNAGMKICTDSCLFGAWVAARIGNTATKTILDIGTGTGLLSLMLAQKSSAEIFAVELENAASTDAAKNFEISMWQERLHLLPGDIRQLSLQHNMDLIICNPPFYDQALEPESEHRKMSMHSLTLSFQNLVEIAGRLLSPHGSFAVMTPYFRSNEFLHMVEKISLYPAEICNVRQTVHHNYFRTLILFSHELTELKTYEISIRDAKNCYTAEFISILKDYYLQF